MLRMISYPHRPPSGHFVCSLNRTYHVLTTRQTDNLTDRQFDLDKVFNQ